MIVVKVVKVVTVVTVAINRKIKKMWWKKKKCDEKIPHTGDKASLDQCV